MKKHVSQCNSVTDVLIYRGLYYRGILLTAAITSIWKNTVIMHIIGILTIHRLLLNLVCSGELGVMNASLSGQALDMPSPAMSQRPCCQLCASTTVTESTAYMCVCMCVCPAAEQDPIWFAPLACEARLWGSTSLYSPNGFPSPLLLTLPQTPVMCTLVNIHIHDIGKERGKRAVMHRSKDRGRGGRPRVKGSGIKVRQRGGKKKMVFTLEKRQSFPQRLTLGLGSF